MQLNNLRYSEGAVHEGKRKGRGQGSARGGTSTRGHKGQQSRSGYTRKRGFEGGQMPIQRRVPKYGFVNRARKVLKGINLDVLQILIDEKNQKHIDLDVLVSNGYASKDDKIKILARGELKFKIDVKAHSFSKKAKQLIESKGGKAEIIS